MYKFLVELLLGEVASRTFSAIEDKLKRTSIFNNMIYRKWIKSTIFYNVDLDSEAERIYHLFIDKIGTFEDLNLAIVRHAAGTSVEQKNEKFSNYIYEEMSSNFDNISDVGKAFLLNFWSLLRKNFYQIMPEEIKFCAMSDNINTLSSEIDELQKECLKLKKDIVLKDRNLLRIFDDTEKYKKFFNKKLFLETTSDIKLSDIYIKPKCNSLFNEQNQPLDLFDYIRGFISHKYTDYDFSTYYKVLFIFGKPGVGKSSFVSYIANNKSSLGKNLYIVRLRDIPHKFILEQTPLTSISNYLNCKHMDLRNSTLILDGLDEISAIYNRNFIRYIKDLIQECGNENIKSIITTRDGYFDFENELQHFAYRVDISLWNEDDFIDWKSIYIQYHPELETTINSNINTLLTHESLKKIFAVPILFYMANAKNILIEKHQTINSLYDEIFKDVFNNRKHDPTLSNNLDDLIGKKLARQIAKEIAFSMHMTGQLIYSNENDPYIGPQNVDEALNRAYNICDDIGGDNRKLTDSDKRKIGELYALTFYYEKSFSDYSAVEFAHKTIAEYFIADKIVEMLFQINNLNPTEITKVLFDCFCCKPVTPIIFEFIREKIIKKKGSIEYNNLKNNLSKYFIENCIIGTAFIPNGCDYYKSTNIFNILPSIFKSTLKVLFDLDFNACDIDLDADQIKSFCIIVDDIAKIEEPSKDYKIHIPFYLNTFDLTNGFFSESNFDESEFVKAVLAGTQFINCNMESANFSEANLDAAVFEDCELSYCYFTDGSYFNTKFENCNLNSSIFKQTVLNDVEFSNCYFQETDFTKCVLNNVNFSNSEFADAILDGINISNAIIDGTTWEDYTKPIKNMILTKEQYEYLISQKLKLINPSIVSKNI